ncbi:MAG: hypothetical protein CALGDGBN_00688 [Pseudomonadales bacterium]|nr:hypothetical protein [Pseudomonadales bacterium]
MSAIELINSGLNHFGLEVRRVPGRPLAPMYRDPLSAIRSVRMQQPAAIEAALDSCVIFNGLSLSRTGWHPYVAAGREFIAGTSQSYRGSILERYHLAWQPIDGLSALIGASKGPSSLAEFPPYVMHAPWFNVLPEQRLKGIAKIARRENAAFGGQEMTIVEGHGLQGPVSSRKGEVEYGRLISVLRSLQHRGYDRTHGDIAVQILKRGEAYRFRLAHGHHRAAALAALGYAVAPCTPRMLIDRDDVDNWPQVSNGTWSIKQALAYFDHHFDFDSLAWARKLGLAYEVDALAS